MIGKGFCEMIFNEKSGAENSNLLMTLLENSPASITIHDFDGNLLYCNQRALDLHGYSRQEFFKLKMQDLIIPENAPVIPDRMAELKEREEISFDMQHFRKDHSVISLQINAKQVKWEGKDVILSVATDNTQRQLEDHKKNNLIEQCTIDRERVEQALRKNDVYYHSIFENSLVGIVLAGTDFKFQKVNTAFCKIVEYEAQELLGKIGIGDIIHPEDENVAKNLLEKLIRRELNQFVHESRFITKSGKIINVLNFVNGIYDESGHYIGGTGIILDITDRKRVENELLNHHNNLEDLIKQRTIELESKNQKLAEEIKERKKIEDALKSSEKSFKTLSKELETILDHIPAIIFSKDLENRYLRVNKFLASAQKTSKDNLDGKSMFDLFPKDEAQAYWDADLQVARSRKPMLNIEEPWTTPEGKKWVNTSKVPMFDENGTVYAILGMGIDITERKRAEEALRESEQTFRSLAENSPNMIFINQGGKIVYANKRCVEVMGYTLEEFYDPQFNFLTLVAPDHRNMIINMFQKHIAGEDIASIEYAVITKKGNRIEGMYGSRLIRYQGKPAILGEITDITEHKRVEKERQVLLEKTLQISDLKSNLISQAAHEFKTPLTAILGWSELIFKAKKQGKNLDTSFDLEDFETIYRNAERLHDLINDFLDIGRIEQGKLELSSQHVNFNELIASATRAVKHLAAQKFITINSESNALELVPVDFRRMEQVLINLLTNAIKYSPENTRVTIKTSLDVVHGRKMFRVIIKDEGYGFTPEELVDAMIPFGKAYTRQEQKRAVQGTGLGLFISRSIVEQHGGSLIILSEGANKGTQVEILLPLC